MRCIHVHLNSRTIAKKKCIYHLMFYRHTSQSADTHPYQIVKWNFVFFFFFALRFVSFSFIFWSQLPAISTLFKKRLSYDNRHVKNRFHFFLAIDKFFCGDKLNWNDGAKKKKLSISSLFFVSFSLTLFFYVFKRARRRQ